MATPLVKNLAKHLTKPQRLALALAFFAAVLGVVLWASLGRSTQATTRADIAAIRIDAQGSNFQYWKEDAASFQALTTFVQAVTDKDSADYLPPEERVAVFDLDGTLLGERSPSYFEWMMYLHRALDDPDYTASDEDRACAQAAKDAIYHGKPTERTGEEMARSQASVFAGMTVPEYDAYVRKFMESDAEGLTHLKRGAEFYLPMAEVVTYLMANDFDVWVVSGTDREALRVLLDGVLPVRRDHFIGKDVALVASGQGDKDSGAYDFDPQADVVVRGGLLQRDVHMNKVAAIVREIGRQPVLAFGNSFGDASMFNYTLAHNPHRAMAFALLCDDLARDRGSKEEADRMRAACAQYGWTPVSMKDDWKTIYGDGVRAK